MAMDLIVVSHSRGRTWRWQLAPSRVLSWLPLLLVAGVLLGAGYGLGQLRAAADANVSSPVAEAFRQQVAHQRAEIVQTRDQAAAASRAVARRLAQLSAQMMRVEATGARLVKVAELDPQEFRFDEAPAVGGPETDLPDLAAQDPMQLTLNRFETQLSERERQLAVLEDLLLASRLQRDVRPSGWPVVGGFISSLFGYRADPFTGRSAFHEGIDFAGAAGSAVQSVAAGVVSFAGERAGYGQLVEINHGNGYVTRYGHNRNVLVREGDSVRKGQAIARMGSSGRSTGPHVHFEVLINGAPVNPAQYVNASR